MESSTHEVLTQEWTNVEEHGEKIACDTATQQEPTSPLRYVARAAKMLAARECYDAHFDVCTNTIAQDVARAKLKRPHSSSGSAVSTPSLKRHCSRTPGCSQ